MSLSPTSFALLGLLSVRSWTTYELANQTTRSLQYFFPRAERHLYAEVKRLADAGLAKSETAFTGKRRTTTYAITPAGRKALRAWLRTTPAPPTLEAEVLARAFFADSGRQQDLLASLEVAREQAVETQRELATMAQSALDGTALSPNERRWARWRCGSSPTSTDSSSTGPSGLRPRSRPGSAPTAATGTVPRR